MADCPTLTVEQRNIAENVALENCRLSDNPIGPDGTTTLSFDVVNNAGVRVDVQYRAEIGPRVQHGNVILEPGRQTEQIDLEGDAFGTGEVPINLGIAGANETTAPVTASIRPSGRRLRDVAERARSRPPQTRSTR